MKIDNLPKYRLIYVKRFSFADSEDIVRIADPYHQQKVDLPLNKEESPLQTALSFLEKRKISVDATSEEISMLVFLSLDNSTRLIQ